MDYAGAKVEVKSMAYLQNWKRPKNSQGSFDIKATGAYFPTKPGVSSGPDAEYYHDAEKKRRADVYVFAVYAERYKDQFDPLNTETWEFLVLSTAELERHFGSQGSVALRRIQDVTETVGHEY